MTSFNHISRSCLILNLPLLGRTLIVTNCCSPHSLEQTSPWSPGVTQKTDKVHTASSPARFLLCSPPPWPQSLSKAPMRTRADNILCSSPVAGLLSKTGLLLRAGWKSHEHLLLHHSKTSSQGFWNTGVEKQDEALKGHVFDEAQGFLAAFHTRVHSSLKRYGGRLSGGCKNSGCWTVREGGRCFVRLCDFFLKCDQTFRHTFRLPF